MIDGVLDHDDIEKETTGPPRHDALRCDDVLLRDVADRLNSRPPAPLPGCREPPIYCWPGATRQAGGSLYITASGRVPTASRALRARQSRRVRYTHSSAARPPLCDAANLLPLAAFCAAWLAAPGCVAPAVTFLCAARSGTYRSSAACGRAPLWLPCSVWRHVARQ